MLKAVMVWVLITNTPYSHSLGAFPTYSACIQARYDYTKQLSSAERQRQKFDCPSQKVYIAANGLPLQGR